jgi:hypothetical protein
MYALWEDTPCLARRPSGEWPTADRLETVRHCNYNWRFFIRPPDRGTASGPGEWRRRLRSAPRNAPTSKKPQRRGSRSSSRGSGSRGLAAQGGNRVVEEGLILKRHLYGNFVTLLNAPGCALPFFHALCSRSGPPLPGQLAQKGRNCWQSGESLRATPFRF